MANIRKLWKFISPVKRNAPRGHNFRKWAVLRLQRSKHTREIILPKTSFIHSSIHPSHTSTVVTAIPSSPFAKIPSLFKLSRSRCRSSFLLPCEECFLRWVFNEFPFIRTLMQKASEGRGAAYGNRFPLLTCHHASLNKSGFYNVFFI